MLVLFEDVYIDTDKVTQVGKVQNLAWAGLTTGEYTFQVRLLEDYWFRSPLYDTRKEAEEAQLAFIKTVNSYKNDYT